jgi:hypothetical protein
MSNQLKTEKALIDVVVVLAITIGNSEWNLKER